MKKLILIAAMLAMAPCAAFGQAAPYSTTTTEIGVLLDNPETKAIIEKHIPGMTKNDQVEMARAMTLKDIQQYSPDAVTDKVLAAIDADLAKVKPAK